RSEYARYFPSGEIDETEMGFSVGFEVKRRAVDVVCATFDGVPRCEANHTASAPTMMTVAAIAPPICHFFEECCWSTAVERRAAAAGPELESRCSRFRSALSSPPD